MIENICLYNFFHPPPFSRYQLYLILIFIAEERVGGVRVRCVTKRESIRHEGKKSAAVL